jgi:hypothetical protein
MPNDSCSPSKIPYGGFSPVRLQTGSQPEPSCAFLELKRRPRIPSRTANLYPAQVRVSPPVVPIPGQVSGSADPDLSRPEALGSPGSYAVSPDHRLLRPHPKLSASPAGLSASSRQVFAPRSGSSRYREAPQFTLPVSLPVPSYVPRQTRWLPSTVSSPSALAFATSAPARHLQIPPLPVPRWACNEAATFALCYGPVSCSLFTGKSFYSRAFTLRGHPRTASSITIRPNSQLPEPDFHRLDKQHYGLRADEHGYTRIKIHEKILTRFKDSTPQ